MEEQIDQPARLPIFAKLAIFRSMTTMNISLPESLKTFVDEQVAGGGFSTSSEYVRELIRRDQGRLHLRGLLLEGAASASTAPINRNYFDSLRERVRKPA